MTKPILSKDIKDITADDIKKILRAKKILDSAPYVLEKGPVDYFDIDIRPELFVRISKEDQKLYKKHMQEVNNILNKYFENEHVTITLSMFD